MNGDETPERPLIAVAAEAKRRQAEVRAVDQVLDGDLSAKERAYVDGVRKHTSERLAVLTAEIEERVEAAVQDDPSRTEEILFTTTEGGDWNRIRAHSVRMPDGAEWDAVNGWRTAVPPSLTFPCKGD